MDLSPVEKYFVEDAVEKLHAALDSSSVALTHLSDFHDEAKLTEVAGKERQKIFSECIKLMQGNFGLSQERVMKVLAAELRKATELYVEKNKSHMGKTTQLLEKLGDYVCENYKSSIELNLRKNPRTELESLQKMFQEGESEAISNFVNQWNSQGNTLVRQLKVKLGSKVQEFNEEIIKKHGNFLQGPVEDERKLFAEMEKALIENIEEVNECIACLGKDSIPKSIVEAKIEEMDQVVGVGVTFSLKEFRQIHKALLEYLTKVKIGLYMADERMLPGAVIEFAHDLALKIKECFQNGKDSSVEQDQSRDLETSPNALMESTAAVAMPNTVGNGSEEGASSRSEPNDSEPEGQSEALSQQHAVHAPDLDLKNLEVECSPTVNRVGKHPRPSPDDQLDMPGTSGNIEGGTTIKRPRFSETPVAGTSSATATEADEHPPLIFRLTSDYIVMGTRSGDYLDILKNWEGQQSTPPVIGIDNESGIFVCGTDAWLCKGHWSLADYLGKGDLQLSFREKVTINLGTEKVTHDITPEFLLGYLLKAMKEHAETELKRRCKSAVITIPVWFASAHRVQVKDAAKIAGFQRICLVNEESVAAHSLALRTYEMSEEFEDKYFLVLSDNFGVLNAILYYFCWQSPGNRKLVMIKHQCWKYTDHDYNFMKRHGHGSPIMKELEEFCGDLSTSTHKHVQRPDQVTFVSNYRWLDAFKSVADNKGFEYSLDFAPTASEMFGGSLLGNMKLNEMHGLVGEYVIEDVYYLHRDKPEFLYASVRKPLPKEYILEIPVGEVKVRFLQKNVRQEDPKDGVCVGELDLSDSLEFAEKSRLLQSSHTLQAVLVASLEAIVSLRSLSWVKNDLSEGAIPLEDYGWTSPNLTEAEREEFEQFVEKIWRAKKDIGVFGVP